jgi:hypothetical protein
MAYFCTCKKCKDSSQNNQGRFLKTKRTYKKHQEAELLLRNISDDLSTTDTNLTNSDDDDIITMKTDSEEDKKSDLSDKQVVPELFQINDFSS